MATLHQSWPGPHTWLVPDHGSMPWVAGNNPTIALRVSDHPLITALCNRLDSPLVSTSANPQGRKPAANAAQVRNYFANKVDYLLPGATQGLAQPTTIHDLVTGRQLR